MDKHAAYEKARALVARMTPEEKISQLSYCAKAIDRLGIPEYNWWNEALHGVARAGTATVFPQAIGLAATFDTALMGDVAHAIGVEGRAKYNAQSRHGDRDIYKGLTFWSPNVNIFRDPRWGRGHETYGEDPFLTSRMGVAFVRGLQGDGDTLLAAACAKHFCVHSGPESERHSFDAHVSRKDMFETYLPAFEALVREARVEAVMGCYNRVNGEPGCGSRALLTELLRDKWGFDGHVVSDCGAIMDFHLHHKVTDTAEESAAMALKAGCDLNCGQAFLHLKTAYADGLVSDEDLTRAAERAMATRYALGILGDGGAYDDIPYSACDSDAHARLAKEAALRSMVLLKNNGVLPLSPERVGTLAVIGPNADSVAVLEGNYNGTSSRYVTFLQGLRRACEDMGARVFFSEGCHLYKDGGDRLAEAVAAAEQADAVVLCVGLDPSLEGEEGDENNLFASGDKKDLELPASQKQLIEAVTATGKPVVILHSSGSAVRVEAGNAILQTWYPGQAGGEAVAEILFGRFNPCGKLPVTFYKSVSDLPDFRDYAMTGRTYRYFRGEPLYPFGYGLSYTSFAFENARYDGEAVRVTVRNTGARRGAEIAQVYIAASGAPDAPDNPALCAFRRVEIDPGEAVEAVLPIPETAFMSVNAEGERVREADEFTLFVGGGQPDARTAALTGARCAAISVKKAREA